MHYISILYIYISPVCVCGYIYIYAHHSNLLTGYTSNKKHSVSRRCFSATVGLCLASRDVSLGWGPWANGNIDVVHITTRK